MTRSRLTSAQTTPAFYRQQAANRRQVDSRLKWGQRRQREEQETCWYLRWQILLLIALIAGSGVLYLVVVFPFLVQWTGQLNSQKYVAPDRSIRPQIPLLNTPVTDTNEPELKLTGFGTPSTTVQFVVNGEADRADQATVSINGEFTHTLHLEEGDNQIQAYSFDDAGLESNLTKTYRVKLDTQAPQLDLEAPENHQQFTGRAQQIMLIQGHTEPGARVLVNASSVTRSDDEGFFELEYRLQEGENPLEIVASDDAGNEDQLTISVDFRL